MRFLQSILKWSLIACAVGAGVGLLNLYRPSIGLGDAAFFLASAVWISIRAVDDRVAELKRWEKK